MLNSSFIVSSSSLSAERSRLSLQIVHLFMRGSSNSFQLAREACWFIEVDISEGEECGSDIFVSTELFDHMQKRNSSSVARRSGNKNKMKNISSSLFASFLIENITKLKQWTEINLIIYKNIFPLSINV